MLQIHRLRLDHGALEGENRRRVTNNPTPCFSWAAAADGKERRQAACRVTVSSGASQLWDSGWIEQEAQELRYAGPPLPAERRIAFTVEIRDACGEQSPPASAWFYLSALPGLQANWIAPQEDVPGRPLYFRRRFAVRPGLESAALYICGGALILSGGMAVLVEFLLNLTFGLHETFLWSFYPLAAGVVLGAMLLVIAMCKPLRRSLHRKFFI